MTIGADAALDQLPPAARADVMRWLAETAGNAGEMVLGCIEAGRTADALPLGLVCGVVFAPESEGQAALGQAAIRLAYQYKNAARQDSYIVDDVTTRAGVGWEVFLATSGGTEDVAIFNQFAATFTFDK